MNDQGLGYVYADGSPKTVLVGGPHDGMTLELMLEPGDQYRVPGPMPPPPWRDWDASPVGILDDGATYVALVHGVAVPRRLGLAWRRYVARLEVSHDGHAPPADWVATRLRRALPDDCVPAPVMLYRDDTFHRTYIQAAIVRA